MKLTKKNYYTNEANWEYMSYSQFKDFSKCPARAMAILKGEYKQEVSDSMLVGSYVDAWLDGEIAQFKSDNPDIFTKAGELKAQFKKAQELCEIIKDDKVLYSMLKGKRQVIKTGTIAGVKFKIKIDSIKTKYIVDGKVLKDCNEIWLDGEKMPFYMEHRYDLQAAIYQKIYQQNTKKLLPFVLAIVTKESAPDKRLIKISNNAIEEALNQVYTFAPIYNDIKRGNAPAIGCGQCEYCRKIKKLSIGDIEEL